MRISPINYTNKNIYYKNNNNNIPARKQQTYYNSPSFGATFWQSVAKGAGVGAAAGAAVGAKTGVVVDTGTLGATMGIATVSGTTVGTVIGGVGGALTGAGRYFLAKNAEKTKLEKQLQEQENKIKIIQEKEAALVREKRLADEKRKKEIEKLQDDLKKQSEQIAALSKFDTKKIEEISGKGLGKIAGYEADKEALNLAFISPYKKSYEQADYDMEVPNGILLYGISGNGKTTLAKAIIEELMATTNSNYYDLSMTRGSELSDKLADVMEKAEKDFENEHKRTIVFIDEFDHFAKIDDPSVGYLKSFMNDCAQKGITVIGTTNHPQKMENAFVINKRRFSVQTVIEPPTQEDISKILKYYLQGVCEEEPDYEKCTKLLMDKTAGEDAKYSCSGIEDIANRIKLRAKREKRLVTPADADAVIEKAKPDIDKKQMYKFRKDFEFMSGGMTYEEYLQGSDDKNEAEEEI